VPAPEDQVAMLLLLEDRRLFEPNVVGLALVASERERVSAAATLGRLADPRGEEALLLLLRDEAVAVRRAAAHALLGFASPLATDALLLAAADPDRETAVRALRALAVAGTPLERVAVALAALPEEEIWRRLATPLPLFPEAARRELAEAGMREAPVELRPTLALAALRDPSPASLPQVRSLLGHGEPFVRGFAARALGLIGTGVADLELLEPLFHDEAFPASQALSAADRLLLGGRAAPPAGWAEALREHLVEVQSAASPNPDVEVALCGLLRHLVFAPGVADALVAVARGEGGPASHGAAISSLLWAAEPRAFDLLGEASIARDPLERAEAARLLGAAPWPLDSVAALQAMLERLLADREPGVRAAGLRALLSRADLLSTTLLRDHALAMRSDASGVVRAELYAGLSRQPLLGLDDLIATAGSRLEREPDPVARRLLVEALQTRGAAERLERGAIVALMERVVADDPSHLVRGSAAAALVAFGRPAPAAPPVHSLDQVGAYRELAQRTSSPHTVTLLTSRGQVVLRLECPLAPKSCLSFLQLASQGFYRGQAFERRDGISLFGGDPTGTGWGGPGYRLRDEPTPLELDAPGVFLLERPFPDGAASRFEITLSPQPWRSGREVALGRVVAGLEVVEKLRPGDRIEDVWVDPEGAESSLRRGAPARAHQGS
jgi:cyclophilin family peptidyl-prolyl cis-trans isomerase/HEAT repeat protein